MKWSDAGAWGECLGFVGQFAALHGSEGLFDEQQVGPQRCIGLIANPDNANVDLEF